MAKELARLLLIADTHLGFDLPLRPRVERRRRGHDFFANLDRALQPALDGQVDAVVHGGDLYYRSRVPAALVERVMGVLVRVAERGVPVYIVPGNHERSRLPNHLWLAHPNLHLFDRPRTFTLTLAGGTVALGGFPFVRDLRDRFPDLLRATGLLETPADVRFLCLHQAVEGAQVGPSNFTFRRGPDVLRGRDLPLGLNAVLAGHIHRAQVLTHDLNGRPLNAPVIYPGSIERTSFAEREEEKGYAIVTVDLTSSQAVESCFVPLPSRPMVPLILEARDGNGKTLLDRLRAELASIDPQAVVQLRLEGPGAQAAAVHLNARRLRELAPASMNISLSIPRTNFTKKRGR